VRPHAEEEKVNGNACGVAAKELEIARHNTLRF
jgi:hypothetical protein